MMEFAAALSNNLERASITIIRKYVDIESSLRNPFSCKEIR